MKLNFDDSVFAGECSICKMKTQVCVVSSVFGGYSFTVCSNCLDKDLEQYDQMVSYISAAGHFPEDINDEYQQFVRYQLECMGIPESKFIEDVNTAIKETDESFDLYCKKHPELHEDNYAEVEDVF